MEEIAKQIPAAAAIIFVVAMFMKFISSRGEQAEKRDEKMMQFFSDRDKRFDQLAETCHAVMKSSVKALEDNTRSIERMEQALSSSIKKEL